MQLNRTVAPVIHDPVDFEYTLQPIHTQILDNGVPLYWLNAGVQHVVELNWVFAAGIWQEDRNAIAAATAGQLKNGTVTRSSRELNEALEFYGASLKVSAGNDHTTVTLHALSKHLPVLLPIVQDIMLNPVFPVAELELYKQNAIQRLLVSLRESEFVANQQIDAALFGKSHPYGRFSEKETIEALQQADLVAFHKAHYQLGRASIFMAGNIGEPEVRLVNTLFGISQPEIAEAPARHYDLPQTLPAPQRISNDPNGVQGAIRIGRRFIGRTHPDFAGAVVLNTILGGYFGSRLMSNIREEKGYTYGIYSSIGAFTHDASLTIHTEVGSDVVEDAVKEIYKEMELLCREKVDAEELLLVKNYLLGNILGDLDGPFSIMQRWRSLILNGFDITRFDQNIRTYKNITPEELLLLAQRYFNPGDFAEIVVI